MNNIKSINGLMKYLREKHHIQIKGSNHKKQLKNVGYYHGYKGYRYIKKPNNRIKFNNFDEILSIIDFDNKVKALLYPQVMFIETALKSYALEIIIQNGKTENFSQIYANLMTDYKSYSNQSDRYKNAYKKRLDTYNRIQNVIANSYASDNNIVSHYLKNDESVPIWAIFEIITLGEFGNLISTFDLNTRKNISQDLGLNVAFDSSGRLLENIIFLIKDLRNAIAHNNVIFDTRFRNRNINTTLLKSLCRDTNIQGINFTSISDYMILVLYILKKLNKTNKELTKVINDFIKTIDILKQNIPSSIFNQIILTNDLQKLQILKYFIKK
ncbi:MAG: Abi family protein [Clostridia bacterium]